MPLLTCVEMTELITDYLEGAMNLEERFEFQKHVGLCRDCREYLHQMQVTVDTLGAMPEDSVVPEQVMGVLLEKFRHWNKRPADHEGESSPPDQDA